MNLDIDTLSGPFRTSHFSPPSCGSDSYTADSLGSSGLVTSCASGSQPTSPGELQSSPTATASPTTNLSPVTTLSPTSPGPSLESLAQPLGNTSGKEQGSGVLASDTNPQRQVFVPCRICGDKASGYHYGVTSCEGCKGFFRRSIQKQIEYRCLRDGKCLVMRLNRNRCQYCRFKKCLAVGMSRDSVRYGRVPKRSKSQDDSSTSLGGLSERRQDEAALENKQLAIYDVILTVSQAHHANCSVTDDKMKGVNKTPLSLISKLEFDSTALTTEQILEVHRCQMFTALAEHITKCIQEVVEFAKRIPGFADLTQDDQLILIKSSFFEIWLTRMARLINTSDSTLTLDDGGVISQGELEIIFTPDLVGAMFQFAESFSQQKLNDTETGLFTALSLAAADRPGVTNLPAVEKIQMSLCEALRLQVSRNHVSEPSLYQRLQEKLRELRTIGFQHAGLLVWFRQRWRILRTPPLFAEIYDIPKSEEDLLL